jgi:hypothetical protein
MFIITSSAKKRIRTKPICPRLSRKLSVRTSSPGIWISSRVIISTTAIYIYLALAFADRKVRMFLTLVSIPIIEITH